MQMARQSRTCQPTQTTDCGDRRIWRDRDDGATDSSSRPQRVPIETCSVDNDRDHEREQVGVISLRAGDDVRCKEMMAESAVRLEANRAVRDDETPGVLDDDERWERVDSPAKERDHLVDPSHLVPVAQPTDYRGVEVVERDMARDQVTRDRITCAERSDLVSAIHVGTMWRLVPHGRALESLEPDCGPSCLRRWWQYWCADGVEWVLAVPCVQVGCHVSSSSRARTDALIT